MRGEDGVTSAAEGGARSGGGGGAAEAVSAGSLYPPLCRAQPAARQVFPSPGGSPGGAGVMAPPCAGRPLSAKVAPARASLWDVGADPERGCRRWVCQPRRANQPPTHASGGRAEAPLRSRLRCSPAELERLPRVRPTRFPNCCVRGPLRAFACILIFSV